MPKQTPLIWPLRGEQLELCPDRTLYWERKRTLIAADIHLGKGALFNRMGIPLPDASVTDLTRLSRAIVKTGAQRLLVLGDLVHGRTGFEAALAAWKPEVELVLVACNHDRGTRPQGFSVILQLDEVSLHFRHEPSIIPGTICGHVHPKVRLTGRGDSLSAACFWLHSDQLVLPAFGSHTGGHWITPDVGDRIAVVGTQMVMEVRIMINQRSHLRDENANN